MENKGDTIQFTVPRDVKTAEVDVQIGITQDCKTGMYFCMTFDQRSSVSEIVMSRTSLFSSPSAATGSAMKYAVSEPA